jgi:hypothetical protein
MLSPLYLPRNYQEGGEKKLSYHLYSLLLSTTPLPAFREDDRASSFFHSSSSPLTATPIKP